MTTDRGKPLAGITAAAWLRLALVSGALGLAAVIAAMVVMNVSRSVTVLSNLLGISGVVLFALTFLLFQVQRRRSNAERAAGYSTVAGLAVATARPGPRGPVVFEPGLREPGELATARVFRTGRFDRATEKVGLAPGRAWFGGADFARATVDSGSLHLFDEEDDASAIVEISRESIVAVVPASFSVGWSGGYEGLAVTVSRAGGDVALPLVFEEPHDMPSFRAALTPSV